MEWIELETMQQLDEIGSSSQPSIIFKDSSRCIVSKMVKRDFQSESILIPENVQVYHLDVIKHRAVSNAVAERWSVRHESPQMLLIQNDVCSYDASHNSIRVADAVTKIVS